MHCIANEKENQQICFAVEKSPKCERNNRKRYKMGYVRGYDHRKLAFRYKKRHRRSGPRGDEENTEDDVLREQIKSTLGEGFLGARRASRMADQRRFQLATGRQTPRTPRRRGLDRSVESGGQEVGDKGTGKGESETKHRYKSRRNDDRKAKRKSKKVYASKNRTGRPYFIINKNKNLADEISKIHRILENLYYSIVKWGFSLLLFTKCCQKCREVYFEEFFPNVAPVK